MAHAVRSARWRHRLPGIVMTTPALVLFVAMFVVPAFLSLYLSLTDWNGYSASPGFVGTENYRNLVDNPRVTRAVILTGLIAVVGTVLCNLAGLGAALLISKPSRANTVVRTILFYPYVISTLVIGFLWSTMLSSNGVVNSTLRSVGLDAVPFLSDPGLAVASVIGVIVWAAFGLNLILYIAGLQSVPQEHYEAATVDGAGRWQQFRNVTLPMIAPIVTVNLVIVLVGLLRTYDLVLALTGGGPAGRTQTIVYLILNDSFQNNALGFGSAQSVVLMLVTGALAFAIAMSRRKAEAKVTN